MAEGSFLFFFFYEISDKNSLLFFIIVRIKGEKGGGERKFARSGRLDVRVERFV